MKNLKLILQTLLIIGQLISCYSYKVYPKEYRKIKYVSTETAYIINPELVNEYDILKSSGIYNLVKDSNSADNIIELISYKNITGWQCGNPMIGTMITLGQLPTTFPNKYSFEYILSNKTQKNDTIKFELKVAQRIWFWDMLTFDKNFEKKAGKALLGSYLNE